MTNDFKNLTLKYVTNNISPGSDNNNTFRDQQTTVNNLTQTLKNILGSVPLNYYILTTDTTTNYLIYGDYSSGGENYGYIAVLSEDGTILKVFTAYDSGTRLSPQMFLTYDESGNIYGFDYTKSKFRIIMLNNVPLNSAKGYFVKLRASYYINYDFKPHFSFYEGTCNIKKVPGEAIYFIFGQTAANKEILIKFVNNVGEANEWYSYEGSTLSYQINGSDMVFTKSGDNTYVDIYYDGNNRTSITHIYYNGSNISTVGDYAIPNAPIQDLRVINKTTAYVSSRKNNSGTYTMYIYRLQNGTYTSINNFNITASTPTYYLDYKNSLLFGKVSGTSSNDLIVKCIAYNGSTFTTSSTYTLSITNYINTGCSVQQTFNLYKFIVQGQSDCVRYSIVIYDGYTGTAKEAYNSVSAARGELYSNGYIMFARQLYNKQVLNNRTIATLEIPNNYLNGITIDEKALLSYSNKKLVSDTNQIQKNIYEQVFINFYNTLNVKDEDTNTLYPNAAAYINQNINIGTQDNCNSSSVCLVQINYSDRTITKTITWTYNTNHYETTFTVDAVGEAPTSIDFMSADGSTLYISKKVSLPVGNNYVFSQKLRIE